MEEKKLASIDQLLIKSWNLFTKVWLNYLVLFVITMFGSLGLLTLIFGQTIARNIILENGQPTFAGDISTMIPIIIIGFVLIFIFATIMGLAMNKLVYSEGEGSPVTIGGSFEYGLKNFPRYFVVNFLTGILVLIGLVLLIIPGIYALTVLAFVPVVFIVEETHSLKALSRSKELVKGKFWTVLFRILFIVLLSIVISSITNRIPFLSLFVSFVVGPITIAYIYYLYKDLAKVGS